MMKTLICIALTATAVSLLSGGEAALQRSPKEVVDQFVKMDVHGDRLKPEGWHAAERLFTKTSEPLRPSTIVVIATHYGVSLAPGEGNKNEFYFGYEKIGQIDTILLRFSQMTNGNEVRTFEKFMVVANEGVHGTKGWKIDGSQPATIHLTAKAAIAYVTEMSKRATDSKVKKNAEQAIARLSLYQ